jgi:hypothetical protein
MILRAGVEFSHDRVGQLLLDAESGAAAYEARNRNSFNASRNFGRRISSGVVTAAGSR